jgi:hypothetical protein
MIREFSDLVTWRHSFLFEFNIVFEHNSGSQHEIPSRVALPVFSGRCRSKAGRRRRISAALAGHLPGAKVNAGLAAQMLEDLEAAGIDVAEMVVGGLGILGLDFYDKIATDLVVEAAEVDYEAACTSDQMENWSGFPPS